MEAVERLLRRELYKKSFYDFVKYFWNTADPSKFIDSKLIQFYCEVFQYMCRNWVGYDAKNIDLSNISKDVEIIDVRQGKHNLCLMVPPRHTKSMIFNVMGPVWLWLSYPIKAVSISHTGGLAGQMNSKRYMIINSPKFQELYDDIQLVSNTSSFLKDSRGGELYSLNRNAFTGYGGDIIINDDLTNAESARKDKAEMNNAWSYYQNTMPSRINDINKCIIMNIQQRLAPNDIAGHIMNDEHLSSQYIFVTLPAIFQHDTLLVYPISGETKLYKKGECLWPERFGDYSSLRYQVGESIFETQYLQNPIATDRTVLKPSLIHEKAINEVPSIDDADMVYASHDLPVKDKDYSDYLGSILAYRIGSNLYIKDCLEKHYAFTQSVQYVKQLDTLFPGSIQVIEDKANGAPVLQQLQDEVPGLQAFNPGTNSKSQRLESASLYMQSGNVIFLKDSWNAKTNEYDLSPALVNLKERLLNFPFVEHDDICDAFSQLVLFVFMDKRYSVYARAFDDANIVKWSPEYNKKYNVVFFNKDGDKFRSLKIAVDYAVTTRFIAYEEHEFKANAKDGLLKLRELHPDHTVFIDCSAVDSLNGIYMDNLSVERYEVEDFDKSVLDLNLAFSKKQMLVSSTCKDTLADIENFKYAKTKDETAKYRTERDGFVACLRIALKYFGGTE